jgi:hypothetical protein
VIVENRMSLRANVDIDLRDALKLFRDYRKEHEDKQIIRKTDFKRLLKAAFPELIFEKRAESYHHKWACIRGLRLRQPGSGEVANIAEFPDAKK